MKKEFQTTKEKFSLGLKEIWTGLDNKEEISSKQKFIYWFFQALQIVKKSPVAFLMTILTISVTLLIFTSYLMIVGNLSNFLETSHTNLQVSVFLKDGMPEGILNTLQSAIKKIDGVDKVEHWSKNDAMNYFKEVMPENSVLLDDLDDANPLPESLEIFLKKDANTKQFLVILKKILADNRNIEQIQYDSGYASKLLKIISEFKVLSMGGLFLILIVSGFIISNTIKLSLWQQQREIEIMKFIGADYNQLRVPYMINGAIQGIFGSVLSIIIARFVFTMMKEVVVKSNLLTWGEVSLSFINFFHILCILFVGLIIGIFASYFTVKKFDEI